MLSKPISVAISAEMSMRTFANSELPIAADIFLSRAGFSGPTSLSLRQRKELQQFIQFAVSNISKHDFGVSQMAIELALTERTLHRKIKMLTGLSPVEFIREVKLDHAKQLCDNREVQTAKELAHKLGYTNAGYLKKLYKNRFGQHPFRN